MSLSADPFSVLVFDTVESEGTKQIRVAHVGIVRCEEDTKVSRIAGENQSLRFQIAEKCFQRGRKKSRMLWLEHEIIVLLRS